jgi:WD40 repeat protein
MKIDPSKTKLVVEYSHPVPLACCAFDPDGRFLFGGGRAAGLVAVDTNSGKPLLLDGHEGWITAAARAGRDTVLTSDSTGKVIAWDCASLPKIRWNYEIHPTSVLGLSVSVDGESFATSDDDGLVRISRIVDGKKIAELPRIKSPVYAVALHPDGKRIATADHVPKTPRVQLWDIQTGKEEAAITASDLSGYRSVEDIEWTGIRGLAFSPDGKLIAASGRNGYDGGACVLVFDSSSGKPLRKLLSDSKGALAYAARFHPDGFLVACCGDIGKGEVRCWQATTGASLAQIKTTSPCLGLDLHPKAPRFAVAQPVAKKGQNPDSGGLAVYEWTA